MSLPRIANSAVVYLSKSFFFFFSPKKCKSQHTELSSDLAKNRFKCKDRGISFTYAKATVMHKKILTICPSRRGITKLFHIKLGENK